MDFETRYPIRSQTVAASSADAAYLSDGDEQTLVVDVIAWQVEEVTVVGDPSKKVIVANGLIIHPLDQTLVVAANELPLTTDDPYTLLRYARLIVKG